MSSPPPVGDLQSARRFRCYQLDPLRDPRWAQLVENHPKASVFHTVAWLQALRRTYGYVPVAFTTSPPTGELKNGMVFCRINSWLTGRRLVSLPFSDHCEPLCDSTEDVNVLVRYLQNELEHQEWRYLQVRPVHGDLSQSGDGSGWVAAQTYFLHTLDLRPDLNELFQNLDKDSVQRRIQRAERAGLVERCGGSQELLKEFYPLFVITRGRHCIPPTPLYWFRNLIQFLGDAVEIRVAYKDGIPVTAILTLRFNRTVYYKYGCSDARFNKLGAMPWLFWKAIVAAKTDGALEFDLGRTDEDNSGLLAFKNHFVSHPQSLVYWRYPKSSHIKSLEGRPSKTAKRLFSLMPLSVLRVIGELTYRHIG